MTKEVGGDGKGYDGIESEEEEETGGAVQLVLR